MVTPASSSTAPQSVVQTTSRKNPVEATSFLPPSPVSPRRGFRALSPHRVNKSVPLAPGSSKRGGTLDKKGLQWFQEAFRRKEEAGKRSTLEAVKGDSQPTGFSYLNGMSAEEGLPESLGAKEPPTPVVSPRGRDASDDEMPEDDSNPQYHLTLKAPVPRLDLTAVSGSEYFRGGKTFTIEELNRFFEEIIPADYQALNPEKEKFEIMAMRLSPSQIKQLVVSDADELTLCCCDIPDVLLETIVAKLKVDRLKDFLCFNCQGIKKVGFLARYSQLRGLSLSWCSALSPDCFGKIPEGAWPNLISLELAHTNITNVTLENLPQLPELTTVDLSFCQRIDSRALIILLKHPNLATVRIEGANVTQSVIEEVQKVRPKIEFIGSPKGAPVLQQETSEVTIEAPEYYPFLRICMYELTRSFSWVKLSQLEKYAKDIERYYKVELEVRGIKCLVPLNTPRGWFYAERALQERDGPNLSIIMDELVSIIRKKGQRLSVDVEGKIDCYTAFWEMYNNFEILRSVVELDLSKRNLTEIPRSFCKLYFSRLERLSFSGNPIQEFPRDYQNSMGKTENWLSKYPSLQVLDFFRCRIQSVGTLFSYQQRVDGDEEEKSDEAVQIDTLPALKVLDLGENLIKELPDSFGVTPNRKSKELKINLTRNLVGSIRPITLENLGGALPVKIELNLMDNLILDSTVAEVRPENVKLIIGIRPNRGMSNAGILLPQDRKVDS